MAKNKYKKPANPYTLATLRARHMGRTLQSIMQDNDIDARRQYLPSNIKGVKEWIKYPHTCDIIGVDDVGASYPKLNALKERHSKKHKQKKAVVKIRKKPSVPKIKPSIKPATLKKYKGTKSRSRRLRERMNLSDPYEKQMAQRLRRSTGMTHIQITNLINEGKKSDFIDIETVIGSVAGESNRKHELYESAKKKIRKKVNDRKSSMDYSFNELDEMEKEFDYLSKQFYGD